MASAQQRVRSTADLIAGLRSAVPAQRAAFMRAIAAAPATTLAFEPLNGTDAIDELIHQARAANDLTDQLSLVNCLMAFRGDPRVVAFGLELLAASDSSVVLIAAQKLVAEVRTESFDAGLGRLLMDTDNRLRARLVSELLRTRDGMSPAQTTRAAILAVDDARSPWPAEAASIEAWLVELDGPFAEDTRSALEMHNQDAFADVASAWDRLSLANRVWLLRWGSERRWPAALEILVKALSTDAQTLRIVALEALCRFPAARAGLQALLDEVARNTAPVLRAAAIRAGGVPVASWESLLENAPEHEVRQAVAERLAEEADVTAVSALVGALHDSNWRVRAAATESLIRIGAAALPSVESLLTHRDSAVVAAAAQIVAASKLAG